MAFQCTHTMGGPAPSLHRESTDSLIRKGQCPLSLFLSNVSECVSNRENKEYVEGLNSKVKLGLYKAFSKEVELKRYLHGVSDARTRLLCKFRSGTHGLNKELGRHRGRNGRTEWVICSNECFMGVSCLQG